MFRSHGRREHFLQVRSRIFLFLKKCLFLVASSMELMGCFFSEKIWKNDSSCIISSDNRSWQSFDNMNLNVIVP